MPVKKKRGRPPKAKNETTSKRVAKTAGRLLKKSKSKPVRKVAASALTQKQNKKRSGGANMARKRRTTRKTTTRRRKTRTHSNPLIKRTSNPGPVIKMAQTAVLALGGGILSGFLANQIPVADARIKAGIPIIGGLVLGVYAGRKMPILQGVALGMVVMGGVSLVKQLAPQLPMLAGENYLAMPSPAYEQYMGKTVEMGATVPFAGESGYEDMSYTSPASI